MQKHTIREFGIDDTEYLCAVVSETMEAEGVYPKDFSFTLEVEYEEEKDNE
jgi:hypothetical protein